MKDRQRRPGRGMPFRKSTERPKSGGGKATLRAFVLLVAVVTVLGSAIAYSIVSGGLSAHDEPSRADGSGDTEIGRGLYPKVPDMRATNTQSLTDGELFSIIEHGIRLTGMPAWGNGTPEGERDSWGLVHFVRRLSKLTPEDTERMESLNPKSPAQFKENEETRRFLQGDSLGAASAPPKKGHQD